MPNLGNAYISIFPQMKGLKKTVSGELAGAGREGGNVLSRMLGKAGKDTGAKLGADLKKGLSAGVTNAGVEAVEKLTAARDKAARAARKAANDTANADKQVEVAEKRLAEAQAKHGKESSQAAQAELRLQKALQQQQIAAETAKVKDDQLAKAKKELKAATDAAAKAEEQAAVKAGGATGAFGKLKASVADMVKGLPGASKMGAVFAPLVEQAKGLGGKLRAGLSKAWNMLPEGFRGAASKAAASVGEHMAAIPGKVGSALSSMTAAAGAALSGLATAAAGAATAAGAAIAGVVKGAVDSFAQNEQLVGGVETLFKGAAGAVQRNAREAFKNAGMSANAYMDNVMGFSASLISSLGGDTEKAAQVADMAIRDMSDNANKMGNDINGIQNAYQSFAKGQFSLLDNLRIGYSGSKEEMERLLADAEKLTGKKFDISNFADIVEAVHAIQDQWEITGTTAEEGATTVEGSMNQMKASWENFKTSLGTGEDTAGAFKNFTDSASTYLQNLVPVVGQIFASLGETIRTNLEKAFPGFTEKIESIKAKIEEIVGYIGPRIQSLWESVQPWIESAWGLIKNIGGAIWNILSPAIDLIGNGIAVVMDVLSGLFTFLQPVWDWLMEKLGGVFSFIGEVVGGIVGWVADLVADLRSKFDNIGKAIEGFKLMWQALKNKIWEVIKSVATTIGGWVNSVRTWFTDVANTVRTKMNSFRDSCRNAVNSVVEFFTSLPGKIRSAVSGAATWLLQTGRDMVSGLINGLGNIATAVYNKIKGGISSAIDSVKGWLGIGSPSRRMAAVIGVPMAQGVAMGFGWETRDMAAGINRDMQAAVRHVEANLGPLDATVTGGTGGAAQAAVGAGRVVYQTINVTATDPASVVAVLQARERVALGV